MMRDSAAKWVVAVCLMGAAAIACISLFGCHSPPIPPPPPPIVVNLPDCADGTAQPRDIDDCEKQTPEGFECVSCLVPKGCRYRPAEVYCTPSCSDPYCGVTRHR
jgi:hypothetical protein